MKMAYKSLSISSIAFINHTVTYESNPHILRVNNAIVPDLLNRHLPFHFHLQRKLLFNRI